MTRPAVSALHARRPGITEDLLGPARDERGRNPYAWLAELLPPTGPVLDLCCGSAALAQHIGAGRYRGIDSSVEELAVAAARRPAAVTSRADALTAEIGGPFVAVTLSMALMLLPLQAVLHRARSWLVPGGVLAATVPMREPTLADTAYNRLLATLGWCGEPFPEPLGALAGRAAASGFALHSDEMRCFAVPIATPANRELLLRSFYLPDQRADQVTAARDVLLEEVAAGRPTIGYPIRRIGQRPTTPLRRSSSTTSCQTPCSWPIRSRRPTTRKPCRACNARLAALAGRIPAWSVHIPASSDPLTRASSSAPPTPRPCAAGSTYTDTSATPPYTHRPDTALSAAQPTTRPPLSATSRGSGRWSSSHASQPGTPVSNVATPLSIPAA